MIRMALTIEQCDTPADALVILEQDFSPRNVKGILAALGHMLRETGAIQNRRAAAEEIGSQAVRWLKKFDKVFSRRLQNLCKCQIGGRSPQVDYNHLLDDLRAFYEEFVTPVVDCEVNAFLELSKARGRTAVFLNDERVRKLSVGEQLAGLSNQATWISCTECSKIGDVIIALEQPASWCLVHLDNSFNELCRVRDRRHKQIKSVAAVEKSKENPDLL